MSAAYSRFAKAGPGRTPPRRLPRWTSAIAVASALAIATAALVASASEAQAPVPPQGAVVIVVGISDGMTVLPVSSGVLPLVCAPAPKED